MKFKLHFSPVILCFSFLVIISIEVKAQYNQRTVLMQESKPVRATLISLNTLNSNFLKSTNNSLKEQPVKVLQTYQPYSLEVATQFYKDQKQLIDLSGFVSIGYSVLTNRQFLIPASTHYLPDRSGNK